MVTFDETAPAVKISLSRVGSLWFRASVVGFSRPFTYAMRGLPGAFWHAGERAYWLPEDLATEAFPSLEAAGLCRVLDWPASPPATPPLTRDLPESLREYQREGIAFLCASTARCGSALLADDPGLGKSVQVLLTLREKAAKRVLIISPAVVTPHWHAEVLKWHPAQGAIVIDSKPKLKKIGSLPDSFAVIVSYDFFRSNLAALDALLGRLDAVVLDEVHYLQNSKSRRSAAVLSLVERARHDNNKLIVIGLSGTPMSSRPRDLWFPLKVLFPRRFGTFINFALRYCAAHQEQVTANRTVWVTDGASRLEELAARLKLVSIRRSRLDVLADLPQRNRIILPVNLPDRVRNQLANVRLDSKDSVAMSAALRLTDQYKTDAAVEMAEQVVASGGRVLVFAMRREHARQLGARLGAPAVTGEVPAARRRGILLDAAVTRGVGVATLYSVTEGIDLTVYDTAIFVGLDWVPKNLLQGEARIHRFGQSRGVNIYYVIALGTIDEAIREKVIWRLDTFSQILDGSAEQRGMISDLQKYDETELLDQIFQAVVSLKGADRGSY